jgi:hypothetical protein
MPSFTAEVPVVPGPSSATTTDSSSFSVTAPTHVCDLYGRLYGSLHVEPKAMTAAAKR